MGRNYNAAARRRENAAAIKRVTHDGKLVPIGELCAVAGVTEQVLVRWITEGRRGERLDAVKRGGAWLSTALSLARFLTATAGEGGAA